MYFRLKFKDGTRVRIAKETFMDYEGDFLELLKSNYENNRPIVLEGVGERNFQDLIAVEIVFD
ncbi:hypothetical protein GJU41_00105 [Bacillus idriensis]|uniref:Uncharacterized protein n=1 Tax=Metabacillus idriensis TaxID=324768 RepID=A0A6I2M462_9BACI|nr:hypothetical protein [Metabacillus idriensis]MRX52357.1 hypothetical protein [Metabacillus idriensis]